MIDSWSDPFNRELIEVLAKCGDKVFTLDAFYAEERQTGSVMALEKS